MTNRTFVYLKTTAPTASDDTSAGYSVGDMWLDTTNDLIYQVIDVTAAAAVWIEVTGRTLTQALTNKTIGNTNTVTLKDTLFTLQDDGDATKQAVFQLSGITTGNTRTLTVPNASITLVGTTATQTLTSKWIQKRVTTETSSATPTINTDNSDLHRITAQAAAITSFTTNLSGTPVDGQTLQIAITDNGTARAITWGASFEASTVPLPTTTVISTRLDVFFVWNTVTSKWRIIGKA